MKMLKRFLAVGLSFSMVWSLISSVAAVQIHNSDVYNGYIDGDINNDRFVDSTDLTFMNMFLNGYNTTAHDRMTERLDVNKDSVIDYRDADMIIDLMSHQIEPFIQGYTDNSDLIEEASGMYYTKVDLSGSTVYTSNYWLGSVNAISEGNSSYQNANDMASELNMTSSSNNKGIVKITSVVGNETITGTGFVVGNNVILTSASNLCKKINGTWQYASSVNCNVYTISGTNVRNGCSALSYHIPVQYTSTLADNSKYNYAAVKLGNVNLSGYKMRLGVPTTLFHENIKTTSVSATSGDNSVYTRLHSLYGQRVNGGFINYTSGFGEVEGQYGAPVYVESGTNAVVLGISCKYVNGMDSFNRAVRINQNIIRLVYNNSLL